MMLDIRQELKTFCISIDKNTLQSVDKPDFNFSNIDYIDFTKNIKEGLKSDSRAPQMMFQLVGLNAIPHSLF